MTPTNPIIVLALLVSMPVGLFFGWVLWNLVFQLGAVKKSTAQALIVDGLGDEWNEFRALHRNWVPTLEHLEVSAVLLAELNLTRARLRNVLFQDCDLTDADFSDAVLEEVDLSGARLVGVKFDRIKQTGLRLNRAVIDEASKSILRDAGVDLAAFDVQVATSPWALGFGDIVRCLRETKCKLEDLSSYQFEVLVEGLLTQQGFEVRRCAQPAIQGYDLLAVAKLSGSREKAVLVDCKAYHTRREIGASPIRRASRERHRTKAWAAVIVTNGAFTSEAVRAAKYYGVHLVDADVLAQAMANEQELMPMDFGTS